jgi:dTDP-glucose 4,6-dehydratase
VRIVVTGGSGFLGSHLCDALLLRGDEVVCLDNLLTGSLSNIEHLFTEPRFQFVMHDVSTYIWVPGPVDAVLHFASPASPRDYLEMPIETLKVGSLGTLNTLGLAKAKGATHMLASTSEIYGDPQQHPQNEEYWGHVNPVGPRGVYDEAKRFSEAMVSAYNREHGVDIRIARIFNTFGPRMRARDGRVISNFVVSALANEPLTIHGDGRQTRSFCFVDDQVRGLIALLDSSVTDPVNIGNPEELSVSDVAELILRLTASSSPLEFLPLPVDDPGRRRPDISKARRELPWEPRITLEAGLATTVEWFAGLQQDPDPALPTQ